MKRWGIVIIIALVLIAIIGVTATLNKGDVAEKKQLNEDATFIIFDSGDEIMRFKMDDIRALGETEFSAIRDTSTTGPETQYFSGVLLKKLYDKAGVSIKEDDIIVNVAADGYTVALKAEKVLMDDNVYIAYLQNGEPLGTRGDGGDGPYMIVVSKDQFSQHWCKYALSSEVKPDE